MRSSFRWSSISLKLDDKYFIICLDEWGKIPRTKIYRLREIPRRIQWWYSLEKKDIIALKIERSFNLSVELSMGIRRVRDVILTMQIFNSSLRYSSMIMKSYYSKSRWRKKRRTSTSRTMLLSSSDEQSSPGCKDYLLTNRYSEDVLQHEFWKITLVIWISEYRYAFFLHPHWRLSPTWIIAFKFRTGKVHNCILNEEYEKDT